MRRLHFPAAVASVLALVAASGASAFEPVAAGSALRAPSGAGAASVVREPGAVGYSVSAVSAAHSLQSLSAGPVAVGTPTSGPPTTLVEGPPASTADGLASTTVPVGTPSGTPTASGEPVPTKPAARNLVITGHGYGHGRGLGQWGAYGYAVEKGWDYRRILDRYYGNTTPGKLSPASAIGVRLLSHDGKAVAVYQATGRLVITINGESIGSDLVAGTSPQPDPGPTTPPKAGPVAVGVPPATIATAGQPSDPTASTVPPSSTQPPLLAPSAIPSGQPVVVRVQLVSTGRFVVSEATSCAGPWNVRGTVSTNAVSLSTGPTENAEPGSMLQVCNSSGRRAYRGDLAAVDGKPGQYLVNQVNMEEYLRGVLPAEVPSGWGSKPNGMEALKAQAVAARSYAAAEKRPGAANTCDTTACQVYSGRGEFRGGAFVSFEDTRADEAIRATAQEVRFDRSGAVVRTEFSSSTGGQTAPGAFPPVVDEGDRNGANPHVQWTVTLTAARLEAGRKLGAFKDIVITLRDGVGPYGGRVQNLDLVFERGRVPLKSGEFLRAYNLRSTLFNAQVVEAGAGGAGGTVPPLDTIPNDGTSGFVGVALPNQNTSIETTPSTTVPKSGKTSTKSAPKTTQPAKGSAKAGTVVVTPVPVDVKAQVQIPVATVPSAKPTTTVKKK
jgi:SpoIID/LytB domain protein